VCVLASWVSLRFASFTKLGGVSPVVQHDDVDAGGLVEELQGENVGEDPSDRRRR
jgi:hypothetical protein